MPPWTYYSQYDEYDCTCGRSFRSLSAVRRHLETSPKHDYCTKCERDFNSDNALTSHLANSPHHGWCTICDEDFDSPDGLLDHQEDEHALCATCNTIYKNPRGLHEHARQSHPYCEACRRIFKSPANLQAHLNSSTHKPATVACPLRGCQKMLISISALVLHWESCSCGSGFTRHQLDAFVRSQPALRRAIVNPNLLLTDAPARTTAPPAPYIASNRAWDSQRSAFICYLCQSAYSSLAGLNQHLASPRHTGPTIKTYKCPNPECAREYATLSALVQHIEAGSCGASRFRLVQGAMDALMRGTRALTL